MYNGGVTVAGNALMAAVRGVEENESAQQILTGYLVDTAIGVGVGVAIGAAVQLSDELIFGGGAAANACFVAGTPVATESGEKAIEQIKAGDMVWSWHELTGECQLEKVVSTHVRQVDGEVIIRTADETITATPSHPFRVENRGWVQARDLQPGDRLISLNGGTERVTQNTTTNAVALVYNFEVVNAHTYFVGEQRILVHNACAWAKRSATISDEPGIYVIRGSNGERYVGSAKNLYDRLVKQRHDWRSLIMDPNSEVFTMKLDNSKIKTSLTEALRVSEEYWIRALGAKDLGLNEISAREAGKYEHYIKTYGLPTFGPPIAH
jgi:hypothetical protein